MAIKTFRELRQKPKVPSFEQLRTQPEFEERPPLLTGDDVPEIYRRMGVKEYRAPTGALEATPARFARPQFPSNAPRDIRMAPTPEKRPSEFRAMPELTGWQKTKRFFTGDRPPLPPNADRMEKLDRVFDRAIGTPLRVFLKFAKGKVFGADDLMWAGIKKITPDSMWDAEVKKMNLEQAMDRAAGYDPSGFEKIVGDLAEFVGRLQTAGQIGRATGILGKAPKDATKLMRAGEAAKLFGLAAVGEQFSKLLSETIDPQTDYQYEGAIGIIKDMGIGAGLSLGHSAIVKPGLAKIAQTAAGKKIIEAADRAVIELTKKFPGLMDTVRRDPRKYFTKEALRWHKQAGGKPFNQWSKKEKVIFKHIVREGERRFTRAYRNYTPPDIVTRGPRRRGLQITGAKQPISAPAVRPVARPVAKVAPSRPTVPQKAAPAVTEGKAEFKVKPPKKLFRGITATGKGAGTASLGKGLYSTPTKSFLKGFAFDKIIELTPEQAFPKNPLVIDTKKESFEDWLLRESGEKNIREFNKKWPDAGEFVQSKGFDGVVAGDEVVKYTVAPPAAVTEGKAETKDEYRARIREKAEKPITQEVIVSKPVEVPKAPKVPVTEQKPTVELKGKEAQVFNEAVRTQEKITAAEAGEVGIEPAGASFTDHIETFNSYQLPATSKIPGIVHEMKVINGKRLAGTMTPAQANSRIYNLRKDLMQAAIKEKIALRLSKIGKVKIGLRKSGIYVPEKFATYKKLKDIEPILGGGQDITRAIQQMDGSLRLKEKVKEPGQAGPIEKYVLWRTRKMTIQKLNWLKEKTLEIQNILSAKKGSAKDKEINLILEQIGKADRDAPIKDVLSKETLASMGKESVKAAQELRQFYDDMIEEQNAARIMRGQDPIPYRQNYSPQILRDTTIWEQLHRGERAAKAIEKGNLPDYIKPNAPFNPRAQAREADMPYDKRVSSARELAESYIMTASKDIFNTSIIQNNKAFIDQLRSQGYEKSANYLSEWNATAYAGVKPGIDRHVKLPKWAQGSLRYFNRLRNMAVFPFNVAWSLSTQPLSLSNTVGRYGLPNTVKGFYQWLKPSVRRQAAKDYYSFIVKSTRRGGVTKQDAANLLGENIKTQKTVGEFVENFATILLTEMEKLLTGTSIQAAKIHGKKRGLRGEALQQYASDGGGKTQSMYNDEDKPMVLRSLLVKSAAPYQTYAFEVANTFREWAGKTGTPPDTKLYAMWSVTRWLAAMIALRLLANQVRGKKWSWWDLVPIPFREFWLSPIAKKLTGEYLTGSSGLPSPVETGVRIAKGINDVLETGSWRKLRNEMMRYGPGVFKIPGGVQWSRMVDAIIAYSNGGVRDRRGRLLFKMDTPEDLARGMATGVWSTKGGREYLEKKKQGRPSRPTRRGRR